MVDLSKIKVGDMVKTREGKCLLVESCCKSVSTGFDVTLSLDGFGTSPFTNDGRYLEDQECVYDIVEHIPNQGEEEELEKDRIFINGKWYVEE